MDVLLKFSALTIFAVVHTMIVEQGEEDIGAVRIIKKDIWYADSKVPLVKRQQFYDSLDVAS